MQTLFKKCQNLCFCPNGPSQEILRLVVRKKLRFLFNKAYFVLRWSLLNIFFVCGFTCLSFIFLVLSKLDIFTPFSSFFFFIDAETWNKPLTFMRFLLMYLQVERYYLNSVSMREANLKSITHSQSFVSFFSIVLIKWLKW